MSPKGHEYPHQNHPDKEHVEKRMEDFFKAYKARDAEAMADFFHPEKFAYSAFSTFIIPPTLPNSRD